MSKMLTVRTPEDRVARIDALVASGAFESRAAFIVAAIVEGYTFIPPTAEEHAWAAAAARRSVADEPW